MEQYTLWHRLSPPREIWLATHPHLPTLLALELLELEDGEAKRQFETFERHRGALLAFSHPNIPAIVDLGKNGEGKGFIATEYAKGVALRGYTQASDAAPWNAPESTLMKTMASNELGSDIWAGLLLAWRLCRILDEFCREFPLDVELALFEDQIQLLEQRPPLVRPNTLPFARLGPQEPPTDRTRHNMKVIASVLWHGIKQWRPETARYSEALVPTPKELYHWCAMEGKYIPLALQQVMKRALTDEPLCYTSTGELGAAIEDVMLEHTELIYVRERAEIFSWLRGKLYSGDLAGCAALFDFRPELRRDALLTSYIWGHIQDEATGLWRREQFEATELHLLATQLPDAVQTMLALAQSSQTSTSTRVRLLHDLKTPPEGSTQRHLREGLGPMLLETTPGIALAAYNALHKLPSHDEPFLPISATHGIHTCNVAPDQLAPLSEGAGHHCHQCQQRVIPLSVHQRAPTSDPCVELNFDDVIAGWLFIQVANSRKCHVLKLGEKLALNVDRSGYGHLHADSELTLFYSSPDTVELSSPRHSREATLEPGLEDWEREALGCQWTWFARQQILGVGRAPLPLRRSNPSPRMHRRIFRGKPAPRRR